MCRRSGHRIQGRVQGLNAKLVEKDAEIAALWERLAKAETNFTREMADLRMALEVLIARAFSEGRIAQTR